MAYDWICLDSKTTNGMMGEVNWDKDLVEPGQIYPSLFDNNDEWDDVQVLIFNLFYCFF